MIRRGEAVGRRRLRAVYLVTAPPVADSFARSDRACSGGAPAYQGRARPVGRSACSSESPTTGDAHVARMPPADLRLAEPPAEVHGPALDHRREVAETGGEVAEGDTQLGDLVRSEERRGGEEGRARL